MAEIAPRDDTGGTVVLVGAGEYLPAMEPVDRRLLDRLAGPARVVVLPTASAPDGPGVPERWARMGVEHFTRLGVAVEPVMLLTRDDAHLPALVARISESNFVYLSGGSPRHLRETLQDSSAWQAIQAVHAAGGIVAGCSAGAMVLAGTMVDGRAWDATRPGLGLVPGILVIPHFDEMAGRVTALVDRLPPGVTLVGIDGLTALVGRRGEYRVWGQRSVTVITPAGETRYTEGKSVPLP
ncbi:MAG TPA: Type 1 glutamine amidotransferase-like domain-containing protein [Thermomicrobiaceae bacterium]|nr:Type 1 glutamine amidotransferase-like domain-containing protein [Thermomicrobiaceae bacterium]